MKIISKYNSFFNLEAFIWICGLFFLFFINVDNSPHFTFCLFKNLGINFCPGCGLGKSVHYLLHFEFIKSLQAHPMGIFAFFILFNRILMLLKQDISGINLNNLKGAYHE